MTLLRVKEREAKVPQVSEDYVRQPRIAVIGAGFSGLGLAYRLQQAGLTDFTVFEKANNVGGTWRDNRYPGLSCDIPAVYYCFTFSRIRTGRMRSLQVPRRRITLRILLLISV